MTGTTSSALAHACWPGASTDDQKVCQDGWFFSMACYKRQASAACGSGADGGFATCRHSSHGEAPTPECQFEGIYTAPRLSLPQAHTYAAHRWQAAGGVGTPVFTIQPICTSCSDLSASPSDILPTEALVETGMAAGRTVGRSGVTADGAATYSIPLWVPPGRMGMQPNLSLEYNSRSGDGILGKGWSLSGYSRISRCTRTLAQDGAAEPIRFDETDRFCLDGMRLVAVNGHYGGHETEYRTESNSFAKIISLNPDALGPTTFVAWLKDGRILTFGGEPTARLQGPRIRVMPSGAAGTITETQEVRYAWAVSEARDRSGNTMTYQYQLYLAPYTGTGIEQWPTGITYTGSTAPGAPAPTRQVWFFYKARPDVTSEYVAGLKLGRSVQLERLEMRGPSPSGVTKLRDYKFCYSSPTRTKRTDASLLVSVQECDELGVCKNRSDFTWLPGSDYFVRYDTGITDVTNGSGRLAEQFWTILTPDLNGDGKDDLLYRVFIDPPDGPPQGIWRSRMSTGTGFGPPQITSIPPSFNWAPVWAGRLADVDHDGRVDLVKLHEQRLLYDVYRSRGDGLLLEQGEWPEEIDTMWLGDVMPAFYMADLNGDGLPEGIRSVWTEDPRNAWGFRLNTSGNLGPYVRWPMQAFSVGMEDKAYTAAIDGSGRTAFLVRDHGVDPHRYSALMIGPNGSPIKSVTTLRRTGPSDSPYWFLDLTGDGLTDALRIELSGASPSYEGRRLTIFINTGNGFLPGRSIELTSPLHYLGRTGYSTDPGTDYGIRVGEFNGDGRPDFFVANSTTSRTTWLVLESQANGDLTPRLLNVPLGDLAVDGFKLHQVLDVNGDGMTDILQVEDGTLHLYVQSRGKPDLLERVEDGLGGTTIFVHEPYRQPAYPYTMTPPLAPVTRGIYVVHRHLVENGNGGLNEFRYTYDDAIMDLHGRGFLGFRTRTLEDVQTGAKTTTEHGHVETRVGTAYPYAGLPTRVETRVTTEDGVEHILERKTTYELTTEANDQVRFVWPNFTEETQREIPAGEPPESAVVTFGQTVSTTYDAFGNLTRSQTKSMYGGVATGDEGLEEAGYDNNTATWLIGQQRWTRNTSRTATGESTTRQAEFQYDPVTGLLQHETLEPTVSTLYLRTTYQRDEQGRVANVTEWDWAGNSRSTAISYEAGDGVFPASITNGLGQRTLLAWHSGLGVQVAEQDANGLTRRWKYDGFGRVRTMERPDGANVSVSYGQRVGSPIFGHSLTVREAGGPTRVIDYDLLERPIWAIEQGFDGALIYSVRTYDAQGRLKYMYRPYRIGETPRATEYTYDKLGRLLSERLPDGTTLERKHSARLVDQWDAKRNQHRFLRDTVGRVTESTDIAPDGKQIQTRYTYGPFSTVTKVEQLTNGVLQHSLRLQYDPYGRQIMLHEPYGGARFHMERMSYNAWGELRMSTDSSDSSLQATTVERDRLGRIVLMRNPDGDTRFTWDTGAGKGIGQLATTLSPDGVSASLAYDALGRLEESTWNILGDTFKVTRQYDAFGRPLGLLYPAVPGDARMQIRFGYTDSGHLQQVQAPTLQTTLWTAEARTSTGNIQTELFGNGVRSSREYDPVRDVLKRIDTTYQTSSLTRNIQKLAYEFEPGGNLQSRTDELADVFEVFTYDHLNRVKSWTVNAGGSRSVHSYRYDDLGNFLGRDVLEGDGTPIALTYDLTKGFGPYAVTRSTLGDYTYDHNGNQITAPGRQVEYTAFDQPRRILKGSDATLLGYTAGQQRAYKQSPNGDVTIYVEGIYERRKTATETYHAHHIPADGRVVAQEMWREAGGIITNVNRVFLHHDHLGSVETITDQGGGVVRHAKYDPFGAHADPTNPAKPLTLPPQPVRWGFTEHEMEDELGLIHMGGRMYDPLTARFLSRDPFVQFPLSGQSYNRYSYALNNPLRWTDPSGFLLHIEPATHMGVSTTEDGTERIEFCHGPCSTEDGEGDGGGGDGGGNGTKAESESDVSVTVSATDDNGSTSTRAGSGEAGGDGGGSDGAGPPPTPPGTERQGMSTIERFQLAMDLGGMIPGVGIAFDLASAGVSAYRGNWGEAGLSLIGAIPGIGDSIKGAAMAAKLGGALATANTMGRAVSKGGCFVAGTPVLTLEGDRPIEEVAPGDWVWAWDETTKEPGWHQVKRTFIKPERAVLRLVLEAADGTTEALGVTEEHPFWVEGRGWTQAQHLATGDAVATVTGTPARVVSLVLTPSLKTVYNLEVEQAHTYFVGGMSVWVHNTSSVSKYVATIYDHQGKHMSVVLEGGGRRLHVEQIMFDDKMTTGAIVDSLDGAVPSISLTLPNGPGALADAQRKLGAALGEYDPSRNSCVTFCGEILRAGGLDVPHKTRDIVRWLRKQRSGQ
ncbi:hypothetical protein BHS04_11890 [Myxococcus xanthus]|nr:hypothetical protein BHS04_11890 [Myxococcus xanthus]